MYTYFNPENGGGYSAYWSLHDFSLYLDSVLIKSYSRSIFFDYLIIRNDGTIEYGPKSGYL